MLPFCIPKRLRRHCFIAVTVLVALVAIALGVYGLPEALQHTPLLPLWTLGKLAHLRCSSFGFCPAPAFVSQSPVTQEHPGRYVVFPQVVQPEDAAKIVQLARQYGRFKQYNLERAAVDFGETFEPGSDGCPPGFVVGVDDRCFLPERFDAAYHYGVTGGLTASKESPDLLASRTAYFRESFLYGDEVNLDGMQFFLEHQSFIDAASGLFDGRPLVEPFCVFANIMIPGQELAVHTDVPEFRGANRSTTPQWLLAVMHHSGLFEQYRLHIATAVSWFHTTGDGDFVFYPNGMTGSAVAHPARYNTAIVTDTDSVFHGVARMNTTAPVPKLGPQALIKYDEARGVWVASERGQELGEYAWDDLRFSVSWKAYCFKDEAERALWVNGEDQLTLDTILTTLKEEMVRRGTIKSVEQDLSPQRLAETLVHTFVHIPFPATTFPFNHCVLLPGWACRQE